MWHNQRQQKSIQARIALFLGFVLLFLHTIGEALHYKIHELPTAVASGHCILGHPRSNFTAPNPQPGPAIANQSPDLLNEDTADHECPLCQIGAMNAVPGTTCILPELSLHAVTLQWLIPHENSPSVTIRDTSSRGPPSLI